MKTRAIISLGSIAVLALLNAATAQTRIQEITVPGTGYLGWRLNAAGDVNADGIPDLAATALGQGAYVFSGANGALLYTIPSHDDDVSGVGDVNADGYDDVVAVNDWLETAQVLSGFDGSILATLSMEDVQVVAPVGDLNQDGHDDFALGSGDADRIRIINGIDLTPLSSIIGYSVDRLRNAGDVNADGFDDLITLEEATDGKIRVWSPVDGALLHEFSVNGGFWYAAVDGAGDVNADGHADLIIGDYSRDRVRVYSGADASLLHQVSNPSGGPYYFGAAVCSAGDVNLDGYADFAYRSGWDGVSVRSGLDACELLFYDHYSYFGWTLAFLGDTNADGFPEFATGNEQGGTEPGNGPGFLEIVSPCPMPVQRYCEGVPNSQGDGAHMRFAGSTSVANANAALGVEAAVPGEPGLFYYGASRVGAPFGDGTRCVSAGAYGQFRLGVPLTVASNGTAFKFLSFVSGVGNLNQGDLAAGSSWHFQFWYRDPAGVGGSGFNLSDAITIVLCP
ncbi:MAG: hypothetical protein ACI835_001880 [Planctomycetota bacterium]|jgi:hypothetical protein